MEILFVSVMFVLPDGTLWHKKNVQRHHHDKKRVFLFALSEQFIHFLFVDQFMNSDFNVEMREHENIIFSSYFCFVFIYFHKNLNICGGNWNFKFFIIIGCFL